MVILRALLVLMLTIYLSKLNPRICKAFLSLTKGPFNSPKEELRIWDVSTNLKGLLQVLTKEHHLPSAIVGKNQSWQTSETFKDHLPWLWIIQQQLVLPIQAIFSCASSTKLKHWIFLHFKAEAVFEFAFPIIVNILLFYRHKVDTQLCWIAIRLTCGWNPNLYANFCIWFATILGKKTDFRPYPYMVQGYMGTGGIYYTLFFYLFTHYMSSLCKLTPFRLDNEANQNERQQTEGKFKRNLNAPVQSDFMVV